MNAVSYILLGVVVVAVVLAIIHVKKNKHSCCGSCCNCPYNGKCGKEQ